MVGKEIRILRKKLREISEVLFILESKGLKNKVYLNELNSRIKNKKSGDKPKFKNNDELINYLIGQRAFIISVLKYTNDENFKKRANRFIERIEKIVEKLYRI